MEPPGLSWAARSFMNLSFTPTSASAPEMSASARALRALMRARCEPVSENSTVSALEKNAERTSKARSRRRVVMCGSPQLGSGASGPGASERPNRC